MVSCLGTGDATKTDEFLEKFQTAFDPPPSSFSENYVADFLKHTLKIPPLYHFYAKKTLFKSPKFATKIFGLEMTPPPFGTFPKIHPFWWGEASLNIEVLSVIFNFDIKFYVR